MSDLRQQLQALAEKWRADAEALDDGCSIVTASAIHARHLRQAADELDGLVRAAKESAQLDESFAGLMAYQGDPEEGEPLVRAASPPAPIGDLAAYGEQQATDALKAKDRDQYQFWQGWNAALEKLAAGGVRSAGPPQEDALEFQRKRADK